MTFKKILTKAALVAAFFLSSVQAQSPDYARRPSTSPCDFVDYPGPTSATQLGCDTFTAADFNFSGHILSLDYANGQAADATHKGYLTAADWIAFNAKWSLAWFNVKNYGAVGNGSTDDTSAINSAIAAFNSAGVGVLYFPAGSYKTTSALTTITADGIVRGDGSVDLERGNAPVSEITLNSTTASLFTVATDYLKFEDFTLRNNAGSTPSAGAGITVTAVTNTQKIDYDSIDVRGFYIGIDIASGADWLMHNTTVRGPVKYAVKIRNTINGDNGDWSIIGSAFYSETYAADAAIRIESSGGAKIVSIKVNEGSYPTTGTKFVRGIDIAPANVTSILLVSASSFENISGEGINVSNSNSWNNISIIGNEFGLYSNTTHSAVNITGQDRISILGNLFIQSGGGTPAAITLNTCDSVFIQGNTTSGFTSVASLTSVTHINNLNGTPTGTGSNPVLDSSPTIITPTIASFANANHNHTNSAGGGTLAESALALTNVTTNNATTSRHGFLPLLDNNAAHFLDGTGAWSTPSGSGGMADPGGNGIVVRTALNTTVARTLVAGTGISLTNADGTAGNITITSSGSAAPIATGTSNPVSPSTNDLFLRTDLGLIIFYDGTRWLSLSEFESTIQINANSVSITATGDKGFVTVPSDFAVYVTSASAWTQTAATNNGSNFWTYAFKWRDSAGTDTTLGSTFTTAGDTAATGTVHKVTVGTALTSTALIFVFTTTTKTGTPGNGTIIAPVIRYRFIIT